MDSTQVITLVTGSGGALIFAILWIKSLLKALEEKNSVIEKKDKRIDYLTEKTISLTTDVQRSLEEKSGCRFIPPLKDHCQKD